ncbi:uncharacterized protein LOC129714213 isoform X2 [Leucoraja erinacea]|uniref:uncharacterized protein LOC129714213 isoform X2 n=1 Tax=Leucoraja erinaceus TaxID=7782 RepID=UPI002456CB6F|nr:uncharacterized protein LOC129714213 isoform X2 [Leucoraja erinacea]
MLPPRNKTQPGTSLTVLLLCVLIVCTSGVLSSREQAVHKLADRKMCADEECSRPGRLFWGADLRPRFLPKVGGGGDPAPGDRPDRAADRGLGFSLLRGKTKRVTVILSPEDQTILHRVFM